MYMYVKQQNLSTFSCAVKTATQYEEAKVFIQGSTHTTASPLASVEAEIKPLQDRTVGSVTQNSYRFNYRSGYRGQGRGRRFRNNYQGSDGDHSGHGGSYTGLGHGVNYNQPQSYYQSHDDYTRVRDHSHAYNHGSNEGSARKQVRAMANRATQLIMLNQKGL